MLEQWFALKTLQLNPASSSLTSSITLFKSSNPPNPEPQGFHLQNRGVLFNILHNEAGLPRCLSGKESSCQCSRCRRRRFDPWVKKIPWRRKWQPTPVFFPENSHRTRIANMHYRLKFTVWFSEPQVPGPPPAHPTEALCGTSGVRFGRPLSSVSSQVR